jgi:hypothetical protein
MRLAEEWSVVFRLNFDYVVSVVDVFNFYIFTLVSFNFILNF